MSSCSFKDVIYKMSLEIIYLIYMYKEDLALNNLQWLICHKAKTTHDVIYISVVNGHDNPSSDPGWGLLHFI